MPTVAELGAKVKSKYPGQYDDLDDVALGQKVKAKYPSDYGDFTDVPQSGLGGFGQEHEQVIRGVLGMLPGSGATAGAILGGGVGVPAGPLGVAGGGTAGLAAGAGAGKALENLGLQLFDLGPDPGFLVKAMGADPKGTTAQTLGVIEEMAKTAAIGKTVGLVTPGGRQAAGEAVKKHGRQALKTGARVVLRGKLGPLYDVLEHMGVKMARKGTPQMVAKQLERHPAFTELGAVVTQRSGGVAVEAGTPIMDQLAKSQPASMVARPIPVGATVTQQAGAAGPPPGSQLLDQLMKAQPAPMPLNASPLGATIERQAPPKGPPWTPSEIAFKQLVQQETAAAKAVPAIAKPTPAGIKAVPMAAEKASRVRVKGVGAPSGSASRHDIQHWSETRKEWVNIEDMDIVHLRNAFNKLGREIGSSNKVAPVSRATFEAMKNEISYRMTRAGGLSAY